MDIRHIYHKTDDGAKAHLHLAILAYWVVSCNRYQLKRVGIKSDWSELVRILSTHKIVSTRMEQTNGEWIEIRQCTQPTANVSEIYEALKLKKEPRKRRKFVWHPKPPDKNINIENQEIRSG